MKVSEKEIEKFLKIIHGDGYGDGYDSGNGNGYGDGYGNGCGDSNGYGSGYGDGDGYGNGNGNGDGYGNGYGDGYGNGYGNGCGDGNGYGDGSGDGDGIKINIFNKQKVYEIDTISCIFISIHQNVAKVLTISKKTFETKEQYVVKYNNLFAHGDSIKKAKEDVERKYLSTLDIESKLKEFVNTFELNKNYSNLDFYNWHTILTGSCDSGKNMFIQDKGISLQGEMTIKEFINLTQDNYKSQIIKQLKKKYDKN